VNSPPHKFAVDYFRISPETLPDKVEDLISDMVKANVEKAVICPSQDTSTSQRPPFKGFKADNDLLARLAEEHPQLIPFGSVDPRKGSEAVREVERCCRDLGLKGLKFHCAPLELYPNDRRYFYPVYEKAQELGMVVQIHTGTTALGYCKIKYLDPLYLDEVAQDFPDLKIVALHMGVGGWEEVCLTVVLRNPNVYLDISGVLPKYFHPSVVRMVDTPLYADKALFGTDYPFLRIPRWMAAFNRFVKNKWKEETVRKVFRENAQKLLAMRRC